MHLKFDGLHTFNEELFIEYKVQSSEGVLVSLNEYDDKTTATLNDKTWLLPFISTEGVLTIQACLGSNDDNCQEHVIFDTKASTKRYTMAFDDGTVLENASGAYQGSKLLAVYDRTTRKISFLAADQDCGQGVGEGCPEVSKRNTKYLNWSVLDTVPQSDEVYSLAIANKKLFVGLANLNKVKVYNISVGGDDYAVSLDTTTEISPSDLFSQFGFSLAVVNNGQHLVVGSPADNRIAIYDIDADGNVSADIKPKLHSSDGGFGFSLAAKDSGFYVGVPFANKISKYQGTTNTDNIQYDTEIVLTGGTTYYGYSIASKNDEFYVTDPEQEDVLNQDGTKSSFTDRISKQHPSILTVCEPDGDDMGCKVKLQEDVANKAGYADFVASSSMKDTDIFVVDTQDKLYISHNLTNGSYLVEQGLLKTFTCGEKCEVTLYNGDPIAFEDIHGTGTDGKVYNYSNILFGFDERQTTEVSSNLYAGGYKAYNNRLYKDHLLAFNDQGNYPDENYYGYNNPANNNSKSVEDSKYYIHEKKLYVSAKDSYTNSQFIWDDEGDNFLFCKSISDCQSSQSGDYNDLYVAQSTVNKYSLYANEVYKAPSLDNKALLLGWNNTTNAENFFWCKDNGTSIRDCKTSKSTDYPSLYVATLTSGDEDKYFLHVNGAETQTYQVKANTTLAAAYNNYIICYDGENDGNYNANKQIPGSQNIYQCQLGVPNDRNLATDVSWPKYEVYGNHTLYKGSQKASGVAWCNDSSCSTYESQGYMKFVDGKQAVGRDFSGVQYLGRPFYTTISSRAMVNGRWYNGEKDKHSSYIGRGRDGDDEEWENGYCKDGYHDSNYFVPVRWGIDDQCKLVGYRFDKKYD